MLRNITYRIERKFRPHYIKLAITDDSVTEEDIMREVNSIIKEHPTEIFYLEIGENLIDVAELDRPVTQQELSKLELSTLAISNLVKERHPNWFIREPTESINREITKEVESSLKDALHVIEVDAV